jgi:hypothetical protein
MLDAATICVVCGEPETNGYEIFICRGANCNLAYCRACSEFMINSGNISCSACHTDVVAPMIDHFMDPLSRELAGTST